MADDSSGSEKRLSGKKKEKIKRGKVYKRELIKLDSGNK